MATVLYYSIADVTAHAAAKEDVLRKEAGGLRRVPITRYTTANHAHLKQLEQWNLVKTIDEQTMTAWHKANAFVEISSNYDVVLQKVVFNGMKYAPLASGVDGVGYLLPQDVPYYKSMFPNAQFIYVDEPLEDAIASYKRTPFEAKANEVVMKSLEDIARLHAAGIAPDLTLPVQKAIPEI